jgi:hypothetical protein
MVKTITPFSTRAKEGATDSPLGDFVNVDQSIVSTADVGFYDQSTGKLTGVQASDKLFGQVQSDPSIANTGTFLTPSVNPNGTWPLDMTGFTDIFIALKPTNGGNYLIHAVMGPDGLSFGGLSPVNPAAILRGNITFTADDTIDNLLADGAEALTADVWNIFYIGNRLANQKLLQFKITNNSGDISTIESAFLRVV